MSEEIKLIKNFLSSLNNKNQVENSKFRSTTLNLIK